jgi:biotin carboxyl carrier protein
MKNFKFKINGHNYDVAIEQIATNLAQVQINGKTIEVEIEGQEAAPVKRVPSPKKEATTPKAATAPAAQTTTKPVATGSNVVKAPIPGSIFKIEVIPGQAVKRGDTLLIMESMKMENSILAKKDGIVGAIYVQLGQTVLQGEPLVDLE